MTPAFDGFRLRAFIREFTNESRRLACKRAATQFFQADVAAAVLPGVKNEDHAAAHFSRLLNHTSRTALTAEQVARALDECRLLLREQLKLLEVRNPDAEAAAIERSICAQIGLNGKSHADIDDFRVDWLIESVQSPGDVGLPDLIEWHPTEQFVSNLRAQQARSHLLIESLTRLISRTQDIDHRLRLLYVVVCAATACHPGSRHHAATLDAAFAAAERAELFRLSNMPQLSDERRIQLARLRSQLPWLHFMPTLDSPFNYLQPMLDGQPLARGTFTSVKLHDDEALLWSRDRLAIHPDDRRAIIEFASTATMKARFLICTGPRRYRHAADRLYDEACTHLAKAEEPYGMVYPVMRELMLGQHAAAERWCESAIEQCLSQGRRQAASAFAALQLHIGALRTGAVTKDSMLRKLAWEATRSSVTCYQFSHVFDAAAVRRLLRGR